MSTKNLLNLVVTILLIVGGLNWGLVGLFGLNLVTLVFGGMDLVVKAIYAAVGVAAVIKLGVLFK